MGGGLVQLAAYGSQDVYLTTNPQITFFKAVYQRCTNFSMESIVQLVDGNINFGGNITVVIARNGDLLGNIVLQVGLPDPPGYILNPSTYDSIGWIQGIGNYLIKYVSIEIGAQQIDEQYGQWMDIWSELNINESHLNGFSQMVGKNYNGNAWEPYDVSAAPGSRLFIPLQFWFCRNPGLSIPLIALQYHEIRLKITFEKFENLLVGVKNGQYQPILPNGSIPRFTSFQIFDTYYYLDTTERRKFAQNPHEYLIEQVQSQSGNVQSLTGENVIRLNLNHPTKELVWVFNRNGTNTPQNDFSIGTNKIPQGTPAKFAPLYNFKLTLNGTDRFKERPGEYFRLVQCYDHHTRIPKAYIYVYSFALKPEEHQPSGSCNFSRIDSSQLIFYLRNNTIPGNIDGPPYENYTELPSYTVYAPCYNVLRIMSGMGGLTYSN
jgi:Large eukaryotic DNA virus major capsid protein/Major capsid protein N-terminus